MVFAEGYPPSNIKFCPECGGSNIEFKDHWNDGDGLLICSSCGLQCYIVKAGGSHGDN